MTSTEFGRIDSDGVLNLAYPPLCQLCRGGVPCAESGYVCSAYQSRLLPIKSSVCKHCGLPMEGIISDISLCADCRNRLWNFDFAHSWWAATGVLRDVIHRYMYESAVYFEPLLRGLFARRFSGTLTNGNWEALVPVPLHLGACGKEVSIKV